MSGKITDEVKAFVKAHPCFSCGGKIDLRKGISILFVDYNNKTDIWTYAKVFHKFRANCRYKSI